MLLSMLIAGCGNDPHPPPLRQKRDDGTPWRVTYRAFPDDPRTLDPQVSYDTTGHVIIAMLYDGLLQYQPFKTDPYELIPGLLATMPQRVKEADGTESYLLELKSGVLFHDDPCFADGKGRELTTEDVIFTFKRICDPKVECPVLSTLQDYIAGLKETFEEAKKAGKMDYSKPMKGVEIIDRTHFRIRMLKPYPQILYWLAMPFTAPVPREAVEFYDGKSHSGEIRPQFKFHPVGTGAYRLAEWSRGRLIRMERNPHYIASTFPSSGWSAEEEARFRPLAESPLPFIDEVQYRIVRESIPAWLLFRQGYFDSSGVGKDVFNTALTASHDLSPELKSRGVRLYKDISPSTFFLVFNMEDSTVGKNRKLRQAISSAYDGDLANEIFSNGIDLNAQELLPPGVFGFQPDFKNPYKQHDLGLAQKLMVEAGYPNGIDPKTGSPLRLTLDVTAESAGLRQLAEFQKNQIEQLGIQVKIEENIWARQQEKVDAGNFQIVAFGWSADYPDPENFFFLFLGPNKPPQGNNHARYANPEFDQLFNKMATMDNTPERLGLIHKLNAILTEDCPLVLLSHDVSFALTQAWAARVSSNPLLSAGIKYANVDVETRAKNQEAWNHPRLWPLWLLGAVAIGALSFAIYWNREAHG